MSLKNKGELYIFEPLIRELHQIPEDYGRFSPSGFKVLLEKNNFKNFKYKTIGGPFTCISYFWDQALQYLPNIKRKKYEKWFKKENLKQISDELRDELIDVVSETGGHLGAGLGVVELTVALHYVFDTPKDKLVWDVSHQSYPHKIITGRKDRIKTLRTWD